MKPQQVFKNQDQSSEDITELMSSVNDPEWQFNASELLDVFKTNLEMHRDIYLQRTKAEFYLGDPGVLEQKEYRLNSVDSLQVDWFSRDPLWNYYEADP